MTSRTITPSMRFEAICYYFGYQGGTIRQLNADTDTDVDVLAVPLDVSGPDSTAGWFGLRTCDRNYRTGTLMPKYRSNPAYWAGVINAYWALGALSGPDFSERFGN